MRALPSVFIAVAVCLVIVNAAFAGDSGKCITGKCHKGMLDRKYVHGPVAVEECGDCHKAAGGGHKFVLVAEPPQLCTRCHDEKEMISRPSCRCHDPHGSDNEHLLLKGVGKVCR